MVTIKYLKREIFRRSRNIVCKLHVAHSLEKISNKMNINELIKINLLSLITNQKRKFVVFESKRVKFSERIEINCNPELAFDYTQDYNQRLDWDTFLKKAVLTGGATKADKGVKAYCVSKNGLGMITEYISFNRPRTVAIKMTKGPFMFKTFIGSWNFKEIQSDTTEVIFLYSFQLRFPFNLLKWLIKRNLQTNVRQRLYDLKANLERKNMAK